MAPSCNKLVALEQHATGHCGVRQLPDEVGAIVDPAHLQLETGHHRAQDVVRVLAATVPLSAKGLDLCECLAVATGQPSSPAPLP